MKQWANRVDANQQQIIQCLQQIGCSVQTLNKVGCGCPDIMVGYDGFNYLMEIKMPKGKCNQIQQEYHDSWMGQIAVVHNFDEALLVMGIGKR